MEDYQTARNHFIDWQNQLNKNMLLPDSGLMHTYQCYFADDPAFIEQINHFSKQVVEQLEPAAMENNIDANLPKIEQYSAFGFREDRVVHHSSYVEAGNIIYGSGLMKYLLQPGQMKKTLSLFLISSHAGEAGHNCPIACSAGVIRILSQYSSLPVTQSYLDKLTRPSFEDNFTGAQFLTEVQGGSDVGANATRAFQDENNNWRIVGEKWFCSNANADLILMTARFDEHVAGTKGLGLFLVPAKMSNGQLNHYKLRRLKQKIGTRSMATAEIDFESALAFPMGRVEDGIHLVMENVLHLSRIFNAFSVLGMARRAHQIAWYYAKNRPAFQQKIIQFPLVKEALGIIRAENTAMIASIFNMVSYQDEQDLQPSKSRQLLLRTLANINKYFTAKRSVENIHHCLDILAGNGTIESFSSLPRLLRDCIVCENWEGTHFVLWMQTLKDIHKFAIDELFLSHLSSQLQKTGENFTHKAIVKEKIAELATQFNQLKLASSEQQSLQIKQVIELMAILNATLALALEIQVDNSPKVKSASLDLFVGRYLINKSSSHEQYMEVLNTLCE